MEFLREKKEILLYILFGGLTTLVNIASYLIFAKALNVEYLPSTIIAWILAVVFAYITNKIWVFNNYNYKIGHMAKEFASFVLCRLFSLGVDVSIMWVGVDILKIDDLFTKMAANIVVVLINYILSKLIIFRKEVM